MGAAGLAAARIAAPIVAARGGGVLARLKAAWGEIVGGELAAIAWPEALGRDGALRLRVVPSRALELQHRAPLVIERINDYFGRAAVARLVLRQGAPPLPPASRPAPPAPLDRSADDALAARLSGVADPQLREALLGLGRAVLAGEERA
jgi:hypothetical protein